MLMVGKGYLGFNSLQTSVANAEIVPTPPADWTNGYNLYNIEFYNLDDCTIIVNNETEIFIYAGKGWGMEYKDRHVISFKVKESNVRFTFNAKY